MTTTHTTQIRWYKGQEVRIHHYGQRAVWGFEVWRRDKDGTVFDFAGSICLDDDQLDHATEAGALDMALEVASWD